MKLDAKTAMHNLIEQIRETFPFGMPEAQICAGPCQGCPMKLLTFLESELDAWDARLAGGECPGFAELSKLTKTSRKIGRALQKSGLLGAAR